MTSIPEKEKQDRHQLINARLDMLLAVFNKRLKPDSLGALKRVFDEVLEVYPRQIISIAFTKAEREFEKFPTPKRMSVLCNELMPPHATRPVLVCDRCRPDGWKLVPRPQQLSDPENARYFMTIRCDHFGQSTYFDTEEVFRAEDCPEGREFLATLKHIAHKGDPS